MLRIDGYLTEFLSSLTTLRDVFCKVFAAVSLHTFTKITFFLGDFGAYVSPEKHAGGTGYSKMALKRHLSPTFSLKSGGLEGKDHKWDMFAGKKQGVGYFYVIPVRPVTTGKIQVLQVLQVLKPIYKYI